MKPGLEMSAEGHGVGRDPRKMTAAEMNALGHQRMSPLEALRARCIDCCAGRREEVRLCVSVDCPAWLFRMGTNPWIERTPEQIDAMRERGKALAARSSADGRAAQNAADPSGVPEATPTPSTSKNQGV